MHSASRRAPDVVIHDSRAEERPVRICGARLFEKKVEHWNRRFPFSDSGRRPARSQMEQCSGKGASNRPRRRSSKDLVRKLRELTDSPGGTAGYSKTELLAWLREFTGLPVGSIEGLRDGVALSRAVALAHEISDVKSPLKRISARDSAEHRVS